MPKIYCQTVPLSSGYELYRTLSIGFWNKDEVIESIDAPDRMIAAIINVGMACKWISDLNAPRSSIVIATDLDGKDMRYDGEHNKLYDCISSRQNFQLNRPKYKAFYGDYIRYLDRLRYLVECYEIPLVLGTVDYG